MKIIKEGYEKNIFSAQRIFSLAYEHYVNNGASCFWLRDFTQFSEETRQELVMFLIENHEEGVFEDFLNNYLVKAQRFGFICFPNQDQFSNADIRAYLLREILLWRKWGLTALENEIYLTAFYLIFYQNCGFLSGDVAMVRQVADDDLRKEIILRLAQVHGRGPGGEFYHKEFLKNFILGYLFGKCLWQSTFANIKDAPLSMQSEVYRDHCYNQRLVNVFSEFARWQKWGIDFSFAEEKLERFFASFLKRNKIDPQREDYNAEAFVNFLETTGFELSLGLKQKLSQCLSRFPFADKQKQHKVLQCLAD